MHDKSTRVLYVLQQLLGGKVVSKQDIQLLFEIDNRTFERDIATLRKYFDQNFNQYEGLDIVYDHSKKGYVLNRFSDCHLSSTDVLALVKLMLGSRAFAQSELEEIVEHLMSQLDAQDKKQVQSFIANERLHFTQLQHGEVLKNRIWDFSWAVDETKFVEMEYKKANNVISSYKLRPVGVVFSDYYFYAVCFVEGRDITYPISFRLDRIVSYKVLTETFKIPYSKRFESGDFRNKINMMYQGELLKFTFKFTGHSIEAVLDKFPISKVIEVGEGYYMIEAMAYESGLLMWLLSQGEWVQVLSPQDLVTKIKQKLEKMINLY